MSLPPIQEQRRIAAHLDAASAAADQMLANARRSIELVKELRLAHLQKAFGPMRSVHERFRYNPIPGLGGLITLGGAGSADFYIQRSGTPENVGRPFREAFQEPGTRLRGPGDPRHHIGVTVVGRHGRDPPGQVDGAA